MSRSQAEREVLAAPLTKPRSVLVVDDELTVLTTVRSWLELQGFHVACAQTCNEAVLAARGGAFDVALIDYRLAEGDEGVNLGRSLRDQFNLPFVLFTAYPSPEVAFAAAKAGATAFISKPITEEQLLVHLGLAFRSDFEGAPTSRTDRWSGAQKRGESPTRVAPPRRWANMILRACTSDDDPSRMEILCSVIAMSQSSFRDLCHICGVQEPRDARDLARFLWALAKTRRAPTAELRELFDVLDGRTLASLFNRAGVPLDASSIPLRDFVLNQKFVPTNLRCMHELAHLAGNSPLFF